MSLTNFTRAALVGALCLGGVATASAQDISQSPTYGTVTLRAGFLPDPNSTSLQAGGSIDVRDTLGDNCRGMVASAPDVDLMYTSGSLPLYISVTSDADTTLVINTPDGQWFCNDDYTGLDPAITFGSPDSGLYNIWVGTYSSSSGLQPAELHISELEVITESSTPTKTPAAGINWQLDPTFGSVSLSSGFLPDPYVVDIIAGGTQDASQVGNYCRGYVASAPDFDLYYDAGSFDLSFIAVSETDTTLVVRDPNGVYHCDDDGFGYPNPQVTVTDPASGLYDVWVGTYSSSGGNPDAQLAISELGYGPDGSSADDGWTTPSPTGNVDWSLPPEYGSVELTAGFMPDPHVVEVTAGGYEEAASVSDSCWGWVTSAPTYDVYYTAGSFDISFTAVSESDTTLMVRAPDGTYHCNDDGYGYPNPQVTITNPQSGLYDVWVGRFGSSNQGDMPPARLAVSELELGPEGGGDTGSIDWSLDPSYGSATLDTGFLPDPHVVTLSAGGSQDASGLGQSCRGYIASAPDYNIHYTAGDVYDLFISASSSTDLTLVVNAPDGSWHCSDDYSGLNPAIEFVDPDSGLYNIWVGTYSSGAGLPSSTLYISETQAHF